MKKKDPPLRLGVLVMGILGLWLTCGIGVYLSQPEWMQRGQFGDMFGAVNALFSALAFAILIYTMWLQQQQLELQRLELEQTREELRRTANAQEASQKALEQQIGLLTLSTQMSAWLRLQELWTEKHFTDGRGRIFERLHLHTRSWDEQERKDAKEICRRMDEFAYLVPFLGLEKVLDVWDDPIAKAWLVLEEIVEEERKGRWQTKWKAFAELGKEALDKLVREGRDPRATQGNQ